MNPSTIDLLCMLGDKAVYVVMLMAAIGQPIEQQRLEAITGYSWQTANKTMAKLNEHRIVARHGTRGPWSLTAYGQQLRLGEAFADAVGTPSKFEGQHPQEDATYPQAEAACPLPPSNIEGQPSNFEGQKPLARSSWLETHPSADHASNQLDSSAPSKFEGLRPQAGDEDPRLYDPAAVLADYDIQEPTRSQLAALRHVTALYIDAHIVGAIKYCKRKSIADPDAPLKIAISRMQQGWTPDKLHPHDAQYLSPNGQLRNRRKYLDWLK
jgi:hypothetical protein